MIDRLVHHAEVINLKGDSYRPKDRDIRRVPKTTLGDQEGVKLDRHQGVKSGQSLTVAAFRETSFADGAAARSTRACESADPIKRLVHRLGEIDRGRIHLQDVSRFHLSRIRSAATSSR